MKMRLVLKNIILKILGVFRIVSQYPLVCFI